MEKTNIAWTDSTHNSWEGCTKTGSPGCDGCYAEVRNQRFHAGQHWGAGAPRLVRSDSYWNEPLKWEKNHEQFFAQNGHRQRVFCSSLADVFDNEAPEGQRDRLWALIRVTPHLDWQILTKRIGNAKRMLPEDWGNGYPNVWIGASIVNQEEADRDIPKLIKIHAAKRFLSMEPLLGHVDLTAHLPDANAETHTMAYITHVYGGIDWVIVGGESGANARPMHPEWARSIRDQCKARHIHFFFKQWGEWIPTNVVPGGDLGGDMRRGKVVIVKPFGENDGHFRKDDQLMRKVGKEKAGSLLDGKEHKDFPRDVAAVCPKCDLGGGPCYHEYNKMIDLPILQQGETY